MAVARWTTASALRRVVLSLLVCVPALVSNASHVDEVIDSYSYPEVRPPVFGQQPSGWFNSPPTPSARLRLRGESRPVLQETLGYDPEIGSNQRQLVRALTQQGQGQRQGQGQGAGAAQRGEQGLGYQSMGRYASGTPVHGWDGPCKVSDAINRAAVQYPGLPGQPEESVPVAAPPPVVKATPTRPCHWSIVTDAEKIRRQIYDPLKQATKATVTQALKNNIKNQIRDAFDETMQNDFPKIYDKEMDQNLDPLVKSAQEFDQTPKGSPDNFGEGLVDKYYPGDTRHISSARGDENGDPKGITPSVTIAPGSNVVPVGS
eukprot:GFYU01020827.1.p1 GENE.GFYU01020827.1~~GFYU01020827.1.p1  ORF type:complete len:318 (-),score=53.97 GFYU01020827.1:329-1282(-)